MPDSDQRHAALEGSRASPSIPECWICGGDGTTGEHKTKRSDLRSVFGKPTQAAPIFLEGGPRTDGEVLYRKGT